MPEFYLGSTPLNQYYLGNTRVNNTTIYTSQVPSNLVSSSLVDFMLAPYVTASLYPGQVSDLVSGNTAPTGSLTLSGNALSGWVSGSNSLSISASSYYSPTTSNISQSWDGWIFLSASTWQTTSPSSSTTPIMPILTLEGVDVIQTFSNGFIPGGTSRRNTLNPWGMYIEDLFINESSWNGQWVYFNTRYRRDESFNDVYQFWFKTKSNVTGSTSIIMSNPAPQVPTGSAVIKFEGFTGMKWGVFRHYRDYYMTDADRNNNFNVEKDYFS